MRPIILLAGVALIATAPVAAEAACQKRATGTVVGAVAGGALGNVVAGRGDRTEGTLLGAAAGGLIGNQVSKCPRSTRRAPVKTSRSYERTRYAEASCRTEQRAYYDPYGQVVYKPTRVCGR
jgi:uncharacterized protein YcfJ